MSAALFELRTGSWDFDFTTGARRPSRGAQPSAPPVGIYTPRGHPEKYVKTPVDVARLSPSYHPEGAAPGPHTAHSTRSRARAPPLAAGGV